MEGYWSGYSATANHAPVSPLRQYERCLLCPRCQARTCLLYTSRNDEQFYRCPAADHYFSVSVDKLQTYHEFIIDVPYCGGCGAGLCRVRKEKYGDNAGRILFRCRVKEGKGSCGYRAWKDEVDVSIMGRVDESTISAEPDILGRKEADQLVLMDILDEGPADVDFVEENGQSERAGVGPSALLDFDDAGPAILNLVEKNRQIVNWVDKKSQSDERTKDEPPMIDTSQLLQCCGGLHCGEEKSERKRIPRKRLRDGNLKECCWMTLAIDQNLVPQLQGWWGRLVFHPLPGLTITGSEHSTCGKSLVNSGSLMALTTDVRGNESPCNMVCGAKLSSLEPLCAGVDMITHKDPLLKTGFGSILSSSVSKAFGMAAEQLQSDLYTLLETMDAREHEAMSRAAEASFNALNHLHFDYKPFKENVTLFIGRAKSLAEIEQTMSNDDADEELEDLCYKEKKKLDELTFTYDLLINGVNKKRKHLKDLQDEISYTKDLLLRVEADLSCGLKELKDMEDQKEKTSVEKEILGVKFLHDSQKLEDFRKFREAKAGFEKARALLRGWSSETQ